MAAGRTDPQVRANQTISASASPQTSAARLGGHCIARCASASNPSVCCSIQGVIQQIFLNQHMNQRECQGRIRARTQREPAITLLRRVGLERINRYNHRALAFGRLNPTP